MDRTYIIAEAGVNHNGSLQMALELVKQAALCKVDTVKFQTFKANHVVSRFAEKAEYQKQTTGSTESQLEMVRKLELSHTDHYALLAQCRSEGIEFLSTPFDLDSIDLLVNEIKVERLKVGSGEISNAQFLLKLARTGKPIILSTGMSNLGDIENALGVIAFGMLTRERDSSARPSISAFRAAYASDEGQTMLRSHVTLLHCTTEYPAPYHDVNLRVLETLRLAFGLPVGLSDHTPGINIPIAAVALGATVIEKHFTLDKSLPGPDHLASLDPSELKSMVEGIRQVEQALGRGLKVATPSEIKNRDIARRSLVARRPIRVGETFSVENLTTKRPGTGISAFEYYDYLGKPSSKDYVEDEEIKT